MQAQQLIFSAKFSQEEKRLISKLNQARMIADQAELCAKSCLLDSIGLVALRNGSYQLKADLAQEEMQLFNERESTCVDNCAYKVFATDKVMRAYLPTRFAELKLNQKELENRLNNPNEEHGPYFYKLSYEDAQEQK